ncbi:hypothetical protein CLI64_17705 [Nostoc sp. CENA543]|uniref:hypothetical protein n=1 Tax=Nostoc sp. CENA543 TaxID=1869241 RepID=UPI000CA34642|nr:hypothetical protein [Nostoc sp. CENA543]AUT02072.1 hypothetical protein CLI64_17705 [Nostoc sp. CENA543]
MFELLSRVLVWLLIGTIAYTLFQRFYPTGTFVGRAVFVIIIVVIALSFINPNEPAVASLWRLISFPLKPLGASVLMLMFAAQKIKAGGIDKPAGYLVGWSLAILLLSSTPAIAYFLVRAPLVTQEAMIPRSELVASQPETIVALEIPSNATQVTDVTGNGILPSSRISQTDLAFNYWQTQIPPYLMQNPQQIRERGLRIEDFVPSAETLQLTTQVWESYLNQVYTFLRGRRG